MIRFSISALFLVPVLVIAFGCTNSGVTLDAAPQPPASDSTQAVARDSSLMVLAVPSARREFRAVWVATVANIDWPSEPGLSVAGQQSELRALFDQALSLRLNAIIFQVRPMGDALFASSLEPWSFYLSGEQGAGPTYDPLAFAVEEAHRRGLELHAWFNPFRAGHPTSEGAYDSLHVSLARPDWVKQYGDLKWMDPGLEAVRDHSLAVITDVVRRYDIDGVHLDDYFYPYAIRDSLDREVPFPDSTSWSKALQEGWSQGLPDWRRSNVDQFVEAMYDSVKAVKPWVKVGISPFGIWRPGYPTEVTGFDAFEGLYADSRRWLREGWLDYLTPQLYWAIDSPGQPYKPLLRWWVGENRRHRHIWPGNYASRVILEGRARWLPDELPRQVKATRETEGASGNVHFSMRALMDGPGADLALADSVYEESALAPATHWLSDDYPGRPDASFRRLGKILLLDVTPGEGSAPFVWHVRERIGMEWTTRVVPAWNSQLRWGDGFPDLLVISGVDRLGKEGPAAMLRPRRGN